MCNFNESQVYNTEFIFYIVTDNSQGSTSCKTNKRWVLKMLLFITEIKLDNR